MKSCKRFLSHKYTNLIRRFYSTDRPYSTAIDYYPDVYERRESNESIGIGDVVKPYHSIPGPKELPIIGNTWRFAPIIGHFKIEELDKVLWSLYKDYGKIVKVGGLVGHPDLLFIFDGDLIEKVFRWEEALPHRPSMPSLYYYKQQLKKHFFGDCPGAVGVHGKIWDKFRRQVQQIVLNPMTARKYVGPLNEIAADFIKRIDNILDENDELPQHFMQELNKWALESVARVSLDTRLGCLQPNLPKDSEPQVIIDSIMTFFRNVPEVELRFPVWRIYHNKKFREYIGALENFRRLCVKHITNSIENQSQETLPEETLSIVQRILNKTGNPMLATALALDFFLVGVDTTSIAVASTMYHLSQNQEKQDRLYHELRKNMMDDTSEVTTAVQEKLVYLRACVKENLRLKPVVLGNGRTLQSDIIISGYEVKKGTHIIFPHLVIGNIERYFEKPESFIPERWLKTGGTCPTSRNKIHPFVSLPFGYGRRACLGKRFAEAELHIVLAKIFRKYKVEYNYGEMPYKVTPAYAPINPLKFKLTRRLQ